MAKLEILQGPDAGRKYEMSGGKLVVGRGIECDIRINEGSISRHHAAIEQVEGVWYIQDLDSANGVFIDGRQVTRTELGQRTTVQFGSVQTLFDATYDSEAMSITAEDTSPEPQADETDRKSVV